MGFLALVVVALTSGQVPAPAADAKMIAAAERLTDDEIAVRIDRWERELYEYRCRLAGDSCRGLDRPRLRRRGFLPNGRPEPLPGAHEEPVPRTEWLERFKGKTRRELLRMKPLMDFRAKALEVLKDEKARRKDSVQTETRYRRKP